MGNQNSQEEPKPKDDSHLYEYKKVGGIMMRVEKPQQQSFQDQSHKRPGQTTNTHHNKDSDISKNAHSSRASQGKQQTQQHQHRHNQMEESEPRKPQNKLQIIQEETVPNHYQTSTEQIYTDGGSCVPGGPGTLGSVRKCVRVYVDKDIEFNVEIPNDQFTCRWILGEVTRRYLDELNKIKKEREMQQLSISSQQQNIGSCSSAQDHSSIVGSKQQHSPSTHKYTHKTIVALKTTDQRESLDYWLTQYDRPLDVLDDGDFLIAHFAKNIHNRSNEICKKDFEQIKVIGRGGFSRVILVRKKDTGRLYAMKIMKKNKILREKKLKPILSERKVLEKLNHPFIIKLHYAFQSNEELFFVMDLCTGGEIFFHLNRLKRFSETQAKFFFSEILLGIEYLHNKNVVYRDIKPENILVDIDGHIRIADFGLSKIIQQRQKSYSFCGSPEYMSPEMLQGTGHDRKVDIYCLGALLFEMLTGLPPFYNKDTNKMYENILNQDLIFPDYMNAQICNLISCMMMKDPTRRFQSISEVKKHPWLRDIQWDDVLNKRTIPPIVPKVRDCHIDPDYIELPLDFEESQYKVRLSTERRYSYYYESTLQSKSATEQSFYNMFFEKNESGSGVVNLLGGAGQGSSVKSGVFHHSSTNPYGASIQSEQSQQSQDSATQNNLAGAAGVQARQANKNIITGLENFTFIDEPKEELEIKKQLIKQKGHHGEEEKKQDASKDKSSKTFSIMNLNQPSVSDKNMKLFSQKQYAANHSIQDPKTKFNADEDSAKQFQNTFTYPQEDSNKNFTLSNKSCLTFEESSQSIAQEYRINESIATSFGPNGNIIGTTSQNGSGCGAQGGSGMNPKQTSILQNVTTNGLTIEEEDDDDLQSVGGGGYGKNSSRVQNSDRQKNDNFSFKNTATTDHNYTTLNNFTPSRILAGEPQGHNPCGLSTQKSTHSNQNIQIQMSTLGGMTTATQSSQYQYTSEDAPNTGRGAQSCSKSQSSMPQFGRSGSQTNNIVKQVSTISTASNANPIMAHGLSSKQQSQISNPYGLQHNHSQATDQTMIEKESEDGSQAAGSGGRSQVVMTPTHGKKTGNKSDRKLSEGQPGLGIGVQAGIKKSSNNLKTINEGGKMKGYPKPPGTITSLPSKQEDKKDGLTDQEVSFSRIPSMSGQQWPQAISGRESANPQKQKEASQQIAAPPSTAVVNSMNVNQEGGAQQAVKKTMHKHKPSYSLSPSNLVAAQTVFQQQQQQQQQQQHLNMKQAAAAQSQKKVTSGGAANKAVGNKLTTSSTNMGKKTIPTTTSQQGIKSFLKVAASNNSTVPASVTHAQQVAQAEAYKTPEDKNATDEVAEGERPIQINNIMQTSSKKVPQSSRAQKFRSMDMTQNILKKSMGAKGAALKNNVAWKQHLLQIQTSQSPIKEQTGISQATAGQKDNQVAQQQIQQESQLAQSYYTVITVADQSKQSHVSNAAMTFNDGGSQQQTMHNREDSLAIKKILSQKESSKVQASKTPERQESDISIDQRSNATTTTIQAQKQSSTGVGAVMDKKRTSDGPQRQTSTAPHPHASKESISSTQHSQTLQHQQQQNKLNMFLTPKGSKIPGTAVGASTVHHAGGMGTGGVATTTITPTSQAYNSLKLPVSQKSMQGVSASTAATLKKASNLAGSTASASTANSIKTMGGLSRNDLNQKKSNTTAAILSKKNPKHI